LSKHTICPAGHKLPHQTKAGQCTPLYCAAKMKAPKAPKVKREPAATDPATAPADDGTEKLIALRRSKADAWAQLVPVPQGLAGAEAEEFADKKLIELLPYAVADLERDLKFGTDEQRVKARDKVLDATGRGKSDKAFGGGAPIIMLNMTPGQIPWAQRVTAQGAEEIAIVDGKGTKS
jgi:hypothetical protein